MNRSEVDEEGKLQKNCKYYLKKTAKGMKPRNKMVEMKMLGTRGLLSSSRTGWGSGQKSVY